jgi:hypothetical protein
MFKWDKKIDTIEQGHVLMSELLKQKVFKVYDVGIQRSNLEDVFLKITGSPII